MVLTGRVNGILIAILFGIVFLDAVLGDHAPWQSVVFGVVSAVLVVAGVVWAIRSWREVVQ